MALKSGGRKLSFDILNGDVFIEDEFVLYRSLSDPMCENGETRKKHKKKKKKKKKNVNLTAIDEDPITGKILDDHRHNELESDDQSYKVETSLSTVHQIPEQEFQNFNLDLQPLVELRQRTVKLNVPSNHLNEFSAKEENDNNNNIVGIGLISSSAQKPQLNGGVVSKLGTAESLDWKRLIAEDPTYLASLEKSPVNFFIGEMRSGNTLRSTTILGNDKERERVYDTIFRLPWRCELLINVGFFVCFDSFLSLLTIMPARILMTFWTSLRTRQFQRPSAADLSDWSCLMVLISGVALLQQIDISLIYHMIRGQGTIKLYVVYNVLEIFDKLCQNFGGDIFQTLFRSAQGLATSSSEDMSFCIWRFVSDLALAAVSSIVHSFVLLAQAITLSTCIVAHNNALLALLVSNNFGEIKSNVFKRFSKDNIHSLVYYDSVERFHISSFLLFVLAQNILEAEGAWFGNFVFNALLVYVCEMVIDITKHSFVAKFNEIKPITYSEFLEDLCKQTLDIQSEDGRKKLTFIPLAPACVVIRVLAPVYAAHLPYGPLPWRLFWILLLLAMTYVMLASLKMMVGMGLQKYATWYINRCRKRKHHLHSD
ncbi:hypothetical protein C5167_032173 [Papaver somniferum]|uniref:Protein POLLEN DEFECTIVE IN GUIDANCE 1 n=1 Tax=Papaver somniferum TaxID=3469 RepID=A0A4Y7K6W2_PAPSO|nr:protein POLLEN DEFECTIVE IN GUIDANCE 1-like [Papaver somniferum]RZC69084.1 hypothetical protein C5167_032173 [Papaver somniferum]